MLFEQPGRHRARSSAARPICSRSRSTAPPRADRHDRAACASSTSAPTACSARCADGAGRQLRRQEPEPRLAHTGRRRCRPPPASEETATTQIVVAFDDNRLASILFGEFGQNLALIEQRLGVDRRRARQSGHASTARATALRPARAACSKVSTSRSRAATTSRRAMSKAPSAWRPPQGSLFDCRARRAQGPADEADQTCASGRCARARRAGRLHPRARARRAHVRHRPGRHRQDLARRRATPPQMLERRRSTASSCRGRRSRPASGSASCPATCARRSIPICARSTTRSTT